MALPPPSGTANHAFTTSLLCTSQATVVVQTGYQYFCKIHFQTMESTIIYAEIQKDYGHKTLK